CSNESRRRGLQRRDFLDLLSKLAFGVPSVIGALHSNPDAGAIAKELAEPDRHGGGDRLALLENIVKVLAGNTQESGNLGLGLTGRGDHLLTQQFARMRRTPVRIALGSMLGHGA